MKFTILPFLPEVSLDLSPFKIPLEYFYQNTNEINILFSLNSITSSTGFYARITQCDKFAYIEPIHKIYCRDIYTSTFEILYPEQLFYNSLDIQNSEKLDYIANRLITDLDTRFNYLNASTENKFKVVEEYLDIKAKYKNKLSTLTKGTNEYSSLETFIDYINRLPSTLTPLNPANIDSITRIIPFKTFQEQNRFLFSIAYHLLANKRLPNILFNGPPGIGKTTFAHRIANLLELPAKTIVLSNKIDSNYLNGFLRSYTNSAPGAIAKTLIELQTLNPVIICDEIDKAPESIQNIFLQLLDPILSKKWFDSYLELPIDTSNINYIFISNDANKLISPLKDRLTKFELTQYSEDVMKEIILSDIIPRLTKNISMNISLDDSVLNKLSAITSLREVEQKIISLIGNVIVNNLDPYITSNILELENENRKSKLGF